ncbi:hypothetical protein SAMN03159341_110151 [Paenibacillus sp. 1_12]|uniref:hypothetical protein n=1 Tax=Paenibacillus sp. 1_12 TaxID=1566278 RepID=UPI0008E52476|nr:hypothetical protein [Paenibacillus sp. 1_12]SFL83305.1 hypothetical protein SAMN03159341_110151 [Paenibacillus sp. 1_12]
MNEVHSLQEMKRIPSELLQERLEVVKQLSADELELYEISKDKLTGDHYLHYAYLHKQVAALGPESNGVETFHQLMPLESDDVLAYIFGEQEFAYPAAWKRSFLRNGPDGDYVWFDPEYTHDEENSEAIANELREQLLRFKQSSELTPEGVSKLLQDLDRTRDRDHSE